jgi:hypothetical protein
MRIANILILYFGCGGVFSASFEYLMYKTKYDKAPVKNWERVFWITCWPFLLLKFLTALFKK